MNDQTIVLELLTIALDVIDASHKESEAIVERKQKNIPTASSTSSLDNHGLFSDVHNSLINQKKGIIIMRELLSVFSTNSHVQTVRETAQPQGGGGGGASAIASAPSGNGSGEERGGVGGRNDQDFNKAHFPVSSSSAIPTTVTSPPPLPPPSTELPQQTLETATTTASSSTKNSSNDVTDDPV